MQDTARTYKTSTGRKVTVTARAQWVDADEAANANKAAAPKGRKGTKSALNPKVGETVQGPEFSVQTLPTNPAASQSRAVNLQARAVTIPLPSSHAQPTAMAAGQRRKSPVHDMPARRLTAEKARELQQMRNPYTMPERSSPASTRDVMGITSKMRPVAALPQAGPSRHSALSTSVVQPGSGRPPIQGGNLEPREVLGLVSMLPSRSVTAGPQHRAFSGGHVSGGAARYGAAMLFDSDEHDEDGIHNNASHPAYHLTAYEEQGEHHHAHYLVDNHRIAASARSIEFADVDYAEPQAPIASQTSFGKRRPHSEALGDDQVEGDVHPARKHARANSPRSEEPDADLAAGEPLDVEGVDGTTPAYITESVAREHARDDLQLPIAQRTKELNGKPKASDYDSVTQEVLALAIQYYKGRLSFEDAFPTKMAELRWAKHAWSKARVELEVDLQYNAELIKMITGYSANLRGEIKTFARSQVAQIYGFELVVNKVYFKSPSDDGVTLRSYYHPFPVVGIALIATAVQCAIDEWASGSFKGVTFSDAAYSKEYQRHLQQIRGYAKKHTIVEDICTRMFEDGCTAAGVKLSDIEEAVPDVMDEDVYAHAAADYNARQGQISDCEDEDEDADVDHL
ncbi:hypothetical protein OH77DRAFT_1516069 [Trametes cingulata]|nr:hypothetical protein OH77DRAFT_1516069 [Trametes cingulata]